MTAEDSDWSLESLTKAYHRGYMAGLTGRPLENQPPASSVSAAAWEAGWTDGDAQRQVSEQCLASLRQIKARKRA